MIWFRDICGSWHKILKNEAGARSNKVKVAGASALGRSY